MPRLNGSRKIHLLGTLLPIWLGFLALRPDAVAAKDIRPNAKANSASSAAAKAGAAPAVLDQKRIHAIYGEGDFERVIAAIDSFTHANNTYSLDDSVFIAKHLAVIYTANPATREKGKGYMFRLLTLLPSAKIVDMFVSDEIDHIFEKVREEYTVRQEQLGQDKPTHQESSRYANDKMTMQARNDPKPANPPRERTGIAAHPYYWIAGGVTAIAAAGAVLYILKPGKTADKTYDIP